MRVELVRSTVEPERLIELAGRLCYGGEYQGDTEFIRQRIADGHESIVEHASATFLISGISRACSHQLVRHRLASYSQESQRYVEMDDLATKAITPFDIDNSNEAADVFSNTMLEIKYSYQRLRDLGIRKEDARFLLPNATATKILVTMNFRELRHFFKIRLTKQAQWEIRELAKRMLELVMEIAPNVFGDITMG